MAALACAIEIKSAQAPRVGLLLDIGLLDVAIKDLRGHAAVDEHELGIVVVTAERRGRKGIEVGIRDDQLLVLIVTAVVPDDGAAVAEEMETRGEAPAART